MPRLDPQQTGLIKEFPHEAPLLSCGFGPTGHFLFAGGRDNHVQCIELETGKKTLLEGHRSWVCAMARSTLSGATQFFTADYVGHVACWSSDDDLPRLAWNIEAHSGTVRGLAVSPNGKLVASGDRNGKIRIWSTDDGKLVRELKGHEGQIYSVVFSPDGKQLISADRFPQTPKLRQWNLQTGEMVREFDAKDVSAYRRGENIEWGGVRGLAVSPDGRQIACCGRHGYAGTCAILLFNAVTGKQTAKLVSTMKGVFHAVRFHPDGFLMAVSGDISSGELCFFKPDEEKPFAITKTSGPCHDFDIHPDGRRVAVAISIGKQTYPESGTLGLYDMLPTGKQPAKPTTNAGKQKAKG